MTTVVGLTGSIRRRSYNHRLLRLAGEALRAAGGRFDAVEPAAIDFPLYNADLQDERGIPTTVVALQARINAAQGVVIASPEYNGGPTPLLKNTIDWVSRVDRATFQPRLIGLLGASPGRRGARHGMGMVAELFTYMRCTVFEPHFSVPEAGTVLDGEGDPALLAELGHWAEAYLAAVERHGAEAADA